MAQYTFKVTYTDVSEYPYRNFTEHFSVHGLHWFEAKKTLLNHMIGQKQDPKIITYRGVN